MRGWGRVGVGKSGRWMDSQTGSNNFPLLNGGMLGEGEGVGAGGGAEVHFYYESKFEIKKKKKYFSFFFFFFFFGGRGWEGLEKLNFLTKLQRIQIEKNVLAF